MLYLSKKAVTRWMIPVTALSFFLDINSLLPDFFHVRLPVQRNIFFQYKFGAKA